MKEIMGSEDIPKPKRRQNTARIDQIAKIIKEIDGILATL